MRIGAIGWMPRLLPAITAIDLALHRVTHGRWGVLDAADLPHLVLVVPGRKSGVARSTPLLCAPRGSDWLIAGSNFGQDRTPTWVYNLAATDEAQVIWKGRSHAVSVQELTDGYRDEAWRTLLDTWPNFALYESRTRRRIRVFVLCPST